MKVAICDDEKIIVEKISSCVMAVSSRYGIDVECFTFTNGYELIDFCESNEPDAIFLDIAMPEIDGFQTANKLLEFKDDVTLVFVSNNEALVFSSYEYKPFWFVPKSQMHLLELVVDKIMCKINNARLISEKLNITIGKTKVEINPMEVLFFKNDDHYIQYFTDKGIKSGSVRGNISDIEKQLKSHFFVRCHNRFIVNCRFVSGVKNTGCILTNGEIIPVSRSKMAETTNALHEYIRRMK